MRQAASRSQLTDERNALARERDALLAVMPTEAKTASAVIGPAKGFIEQINELTGRVNELTGERNALTARNNELTHQVNVLTGERNELTHQVNVLTGERNELVGKINKLTGELRTKKASPETK
jgi:uncharacterized coiled-coil DUF342 family protein